MEVISATQRILMAIGLCSLFVSKLGKFSLYARVLAQSILLETTNRIIINHYRCSRIIWRYANWQFRQFSIERRKFEASLTKQKKNMDERK